MADELHERIAVSVREVLNLKEQLEQMRSDRTRLEEQVASWQGQAAALHDELEKAKARGDHYLRWATEITKQLHNVGLFVQDALAQARQEVAKAGNGPAQAATGETLEAVEQALATTNEGGAPIPRRRT